MEAENAVRVLKPEDCVLFETHDKHVLVAVVVVIVVVVVVVEVSSS